MVGTSFSMNCRDIEWCALNGIIYPEDGLLDVDSYRPLKEGVSVYITCSSHHMVDEKLDLK